jgi:hypothetical protein
MTALRGGFHTSDTWRSLAAFCIAWHASTTSRALWEWTHGTHPAGGGATSWLKIKNPNYSEWSIVTNCSTSAGAQAHG